MLSPFGPAEQLQGGSRLISASSFWMRLALLLMCEPGGIVSAAMRPQRLQRRSFNPHERVCGNPALGADGLAENAGAKIQTSACPASFADVCAFYVLNELRVHVPLVSRMVAIRWEA